MIFDISKNTRGGQAILCFLASCLVLSGCRIDIANPSDSTELPAVQAPPPIEVVLEQRVDAEYERWLASAVILAISMEYPDFDLTGIYAASTTSLEQREDSGGVYVLFSSNGTDIAIESLPIEAERTEEGTRDISAMELGFATFDEVPPDAVCADQMERLTMEELEDTLSQSLLVSLYYH